MEQKNKQKSLSSYFHIEKDSFLKEHISNSMTTTTIPKKILWRPNNYRRKIEVKEKDNSGMNRIKTTIRHTTIGRHNKLLSVKNFKPNITIQYGRSTLTAIYSQNIIAGNKETFLIERQTIKEIQDEIDKKRESIRERMDNALLVFSRQFKLYIPLKNPRWDRYEDWIKGDDFIDKIPRETIIHDTIFKKVYGDGIEFKNTGKGEAPTVHMKNYIKNRAVEDISPLIAEEINQFHNSTAKNLAEFSEQIRLHLAVLNKIDRSFRKFNELLSQKKLNRWCQWQKNQ